MWVRDFGFKVNCLRDAYTERTVYVMVAVLEGRRVPVSSNGCDFLNGAAACTECRQSILKSVLDHPELISGKPVMPL